MDEHDDELPVALSVAATGGPDNPGLRVDGARDLADRAAAAQTWARRARLGQDAVNRAAEVKLRAERRAGELLAVTVQHGGDRRSESRSDTPTLNDLGVTREQSSEWQALAALPDEDFERLQACRERPRDDGRATLDRHP